MTSFVQGVGNAPKGVVCSALNNPFVDGRNWGPTPPYVGEGVGSNPLVRDWYNNRIDGLKAVFCNKVESTDNLPPPPFTGGQCPGVLYQVRFFIQTSAYTSSSCSSFNTSSATTGWLGSIPGPISDVRVELSNPGTCGPRTYQVLVTGAGGDVIVNQGTVTIGRVPGSTFISNVEIRRVDGFPDTCGNIGVEYNPTNIYNITADVTFNNEENVEVTKLGDFNLLAPVFLPGSIQLSAPISIPFTLQVDELKFVGEFFPDGTVNLFPDLEVNIGSPGDPQPPPGVEPPPRDPQYEVQPSPEQVNRLVGVWVVMTDPGSRATEVLEGGVTHYYPRYGIVKFLMQFGDQTVLSTGVDVKTARAYVPAPDTGRAVGVRFFGYYGGAASLTPAYASVNQDLLIEPSP